MCVCLPAALALVTPGGIATVHAAATAEAEVEATPVGTWRTIDDETGEARSIVRIYERDGELYGRIIELFENPDATCDKCTGDAKGQPVLGMLIMWGLERDGDEWSGGQVFDPEKGKTYRARVWLEGDDTLRLRGYSGPFFRTQTWQRVM